MNTKNNLMKFMTITVRNKRYCLRNRKNRDLKIN